MFFFLCSAAFTAAAISCCKFVGFSAFSVVFNTWKALSVGLRSGDWLGHWKCSCYVRIFKRQTHWKKHIFIKNFANTIGKNIAWNSNLNFSGINSGRLYKVSRVHNKVLYEVLSQGELLQSLFIILTRWFNSLISWVSPKLHNSNSSISSAQLSV